MDSGVIYPLNALLILNINHCVIMIFRIVGSINVPVRCQTPKWLKPRDHQYITLTLKAILCATFEDPSTCLLSKEQSRCGLQHRT